MSGHNKWSKIKHKKGALDISKGKIFSKIAKEIGVAVRIAGDSLQYNFRLRTALDWAKAENMPADNIKRAIDKALGKDDKSHYEELIYEGFGFANVALIVECLSDNKNRTISSIRKIFNKHGCQIGAIGSTAHLFNHIVQIEIKSSTVDEFKLLEIVANCGADDLILENGKFVILAPMEKFKQLIDSLDRLGVAPLHTEIKKQAKHKLIIDDEQSATQNIELIEALEDDEDVQHIFSNFEIADELLEKMEKA